MDTRQANPERVSNRRGQGSITNRNSESFRRVEGGGGRHPLSNHATWLVAGARNHRYRLVSKRAQTRFNLYLRECTGLALIRRKLG